MLAALMLGSINSNDQNETQRATPSDIGAKGVALSLFKINK